MVVGAFGVVYRAWDPQLRREVALKILRQKPARSLEPTASPLIDEGRAAARIRHPHVVTVHGIDVHDGQVGLWMELIAGKSLEYLLERHGPLSPPELTRLARELGAALAAVHAAARSPPIFGLRDKPLARRAVAQPGAPAKRRNSRRDCPGRKIACYIGGRVI